VSEDHKTTLTGNISLRDARSRIRPISSDPTRTTAIQRRYLVDMTRRFNNLVRNARTLIVTENAFGPIEPFVINTRFAFETDPRKIALFQAWLAEQIRTNVLEIVPGSPPWTDQYIRSTYNRATTRAFSATRRGSRSRSGPFGGTQEEFLRASFSSEVVLERVQILSTRAFQNLQGITDAISRELSTIFADGISQGQSPNTIARNISTRIDSITRVRAVRLARTEIIHAFSEASLDTYERLGVTQVGVQAEWATAGDDRVCPQCEPLNGAVFPIQEARGLIPLHPQCRCAWLPFFETAPRT